jgi:hypothetical protein
LNDIAQAAIGELELEAHDVNRLEQSGTKLAVHLNRSGEDFARESVQGIVVDQHAASFCNMPTIENQARSMDRWDAAGRICLGRRAG